MKLDHTQGGFVPDPEREGYYEVKTWWRSIEDFTAWTRSPAFAEAHRNQAPKEMFRGTTRNTCAQRGRDRRPQVARAARDRSFEALRLMPK